MKMEPVYAAGRSVRLSPLQRIMQKTGRRPTECRFPRELQILDNPITYGK